MKPEFGRSKFLISLLLIWRVPNCTPAVSQLPLAKSHTAYLKLSQAAQVMLSWHAITCPQILRASSTSCSDNSQPKSPVESWDVLNTFIQSCPLPNIYFCTPAISLNLHYCHGKKLHDNAAVPTKKTKENYHIGGLKIHFTVTQTHWRKQLRKRYQMIRGKWKLSDMKSIIILVWE